MPPNTRPVLLPTQSVDSTLIPKMPGFWHYRSYRLFLTLVMGLVIFVHAMARATLSIGIICMVNSTASRSRPVKTETNASVEDDGCGGERRSMINDQSQQTWTNAEKSLLFSSLYWGGVLCALPAGMVADRYSAKMVVLCCLLLQVLGCLLTPVTVTYGGLVPLLLLRSMMGVGGQAVINPAIAVIISRWIPPAERSTAIALYTGGNQAALITAMPLNALLCQSKQLLGGWPAIFYVSGFITVLAMVPWVVFVDNTPQKNRWISKEEQNHVERSLRLQELGDTKTVLKRVPWKKMCTSMALWSCITSNVSTTILICILESYIPTYFKQVLRLDLSSNGILSAVPYMAQWVSKIVFASSADLLKKKTRLSHTWICRFSNCLNTFATGAFLIACGYSDCGRTALAVILLTIANFLTSGQVTGFWTSLLCIAPAFTGTVNSLARWFGQVASVVAPYIVGGVVVEGTSGEWRVLYFITVAGLVVSGVQFLIFGSAEVQPWAKLDTGSSSASPSLDRANGVTRAREVVNYRSDLDANASRDSQPNAETGSARLDALSSSRETMLSTVYDKQHYSFYSYV